jgi:transketolase
VRAEFIDELATIAEADDRVLLLTADLGFSVIEPFVERFPERFVNVGVSEQNLIGVATGLARDGFVPFVYSIATFASMRPYEFIRNGPVLHQLPVRIVGAGGGVDYGHGGVTHFALEDVAILRAQPDLTVVVPADVAQARAALRASVTHHGPIYFRVARASVPLVDLDAQLEAGYHFGDLHRIGDETPEVLFVALGPIAHEALGAAVELQRRGTRSAVAVVSSFNPFPAEAVARLARDARVVISAEAHYRSGGLGSAVAEALADRAIATPLSREGIAEMPRGYSGSPTWLLEHFGLSAGRLAERATRLLDEALALHR